MYLRYMDLSDLVGYIKKLEIILPDGAREKDTEYDGLFSYAGEWHSAIVGLAAGLFGPYEIMVFLVAVAIDEEITAGTKALSEFRSEPWYGMGGMIGGFVVRKVFFNETLPTYTLIEILDIVHLVG